MRLQPRSLWILALVAVLLAGCGKPSKEDLVRKAEGITQKADLEKKLGKPDDIAKLGPMERWTYRASNGELIFVIVGSAVTLQATGSSDPKK